MVLVGLGITRLPVPPVPADTLAKPDSVVVNEIRNWAWGYGLGAGPKLSSEVLLRFMDGACVITMVAALIDGKIGLTDAMQSLLSRPLKPE